MQCIFDCHPSILAVVFQSNETFAFNCSDMHLLTSVTSQQESMFLKLSQQVSTLHLVT